MHPPEVVAPVDPDSDKHAYILLDPRRQHITWLCFGLHMEWCALGTLGSQGVAHSEQNVSRVGALPIMAAPDLIQSDRFQPHRGCMHPRH